MAQFTIYRNPGRNRDIPFVVQIQSTRMDRSVGRVVMPLVRRSGGAPPDHPLTPHLHVGGEDIFANPFDEGPLRWVGTGFLKLSPRIADPSCRILRNYVYYEYSDCRRG
ncbi:CcdB family protein [Nguyenibacter vanlangensis]|uniref:Toxin CcdB n=1 Tax=Nguyenibacter vanlangensis TaxID=1216886 RepID=A0A7Y7M5U8_9PROT|nr:CcdB family protein [Nguyenibacter vanlangensis]NVN11407.1 CcdB family protein [Nguyenibacter vanlangensis]